MIAPPSSPIRKRNMNGGYGESAPEAVADSASDCLGSTAVHSLSSGNRQQWVGCGPSQERVLAAKLRRKQTIGARAMNLPKRQNVPGSLPGE